MNLLLMQASKISGLPRNGLISLIDPYRDLYGRNILPAGSENFVTGWTTFGGATITVTDYPTTINGVEVVAKRIQSSGGTSVYKYYHSFLLGIAHSSRNALYAKLLSGNCQIRDSENSSASTAVNITDTWQKCVVNVDNTVGPNCSIGFRTSLEGDTLDIVVYQPQINLGSALYPYSLPAGLPQSALDYSQHGNSFQNGSTSGADTNDASWSGNGLVFSGDDFLISASPLINSSDFTIITVAKVIDATPNNDLVTQFISSSDGRIILATAVEKLKCYIGGVARVLSNTTILDNTNYCVGIRRQTDQLNLMINSTVGTPVVNNTPIYQTQTRIGTYGAGEFLNGTIYLTAIYNRALTDAEYMQAYNSLRRLMASRGVTI